MDSKTGTTGRNLPSFASIGPHGHRGRMRARLLTHGPDGLADYEVLEMLLFLGIPRRDTKPQAKALINRFGSLEASLTAAPGDLRQAGVEAAAGEVFGIVAESARRLARSEVRSRPLLNDMPRLLDHLDLPARLQRPPHLAVLLLNNRNQLLHELHVPETQPAPDVGQAVARRAIQVYATALILATCRPGCRPEVTDRDAAVTGCVARAAAALSIAVHDHWVFGAGPHIGLRRLGLL